MRLDDTQAILFVYRNHELRRKTLDGHGPARRAERLPAVRIIQDLQSSGRHPVHVTGFEQISGFPVGHDFGETPGVRGHDRGTGRHRFERSQAEGFGLARQQEQVSARQELLHRTVFAEKNHTVLHAQDLSSLDRTRPLGPVADHDQAGWHSFGYARENPHHVPYALHGPEVRHVH